MHHVQGLHPHPHPTSAQCSHLTPGRRDVDNSFMILLPWEALILSVLLDPRLWALPQSPSSR